MNITHIEYKKLIGSIWPGGETFQYYIYPKDAMYADKDFLFRLSTATVKDASASFSNFIGYKRYFLMLNNELDLVINRNQHIQKDKFEIVDFRSEDDVKSNSLGQDLNFVVKDDISESSFKIDQGFFTFEDDFILLLALEAHTIFVDNVEYELNEYDVIAIENNSRNKVDVITSKPTVISQIKLPYQL